MNCVCVCAVGACAHSTCILNELIFVRPSVAIKKSIPYSTIQQETDAFVVVARCGCMSVITVICILIHIILWKIRQPTRTVNRYIRRTGELIWNSCTVVHFVVMGLREIQIMLQNIINIVIRWLAYPWKDVALETNAKCANVMHNLW